MQNNERYYGGTQMVLWKNRTSIIVKAHRLSTVKNADNIIVLETEIVEQETINS
jgi:ABC-type transport system involved in Fe-S cluster assembly fused permease/ATPase subunit